MVRKTKKTSLKHSSVGKNAFMREVRGEEPDLVEADRKVTVTQITTHYNSGMQKSISEHTVRQTSKWIGYSCRSLIKISNKYVSAHWIVFPTHFFGIVTSRPIIFSYFPVPRLNQSPEACTERMSLHQTGI